MKKPRPESKNSRTIQRSWRWLWSALLGGSILLWASSAAGQKRCNPDDPTSCYSYITQGQAAPFTGKLLTPRMAADLTVRSEECDERVKITRDEEKERGEVKLQAEIDRRANDQDAHTHSMDVMRSGMEAYKKNFAPKWYDNPTLWFCLGVLTTTGVIALSVTIIEKTRPSVVTVP